MNQFTQHNFRTSSLNNFLSKELSWIILKQALSQVLSNKVRHIVGKSRRRSSDSILLKSRRRLLPSILGRKEIEPQTADELLDGVLVARGNIRSSRSLRYFHKKTITSISLSGSDNNQGVIEDNQD